MLTISPNTPSGPAMTPADTPESSLVTAEQASQAVASMIEAIPAIAEEYAPHLKCTHAEAMIIVMGALAGKTNDVWRLHANLPRPYMINKRAREIAGWPEEGGRVPAWARHLARFSYLLTDLEKLRKEAKPEEKPKEEPATEPLRPPRVTPRVKW